ncbi:MAG: type I-F CRISPR-associated protein Csy2 [Pyramidobacter sp.]|jgi:CRISPR-associated protein Csy2
MTPYLLLSHMYIHNANALSSPLTVGVPAMTAWLGAVHALERKVTQSTELQSVRLPRVGISFHKTDLQTYKGPGDYVFSVIGTSNPLDEKGKRPSFIEEPRIHLEVSLLVELQGVNGDNEKQFLSAVNQLLPTMKMAGGDLLNVKKTQVLYADPDKPPTIRKALRALMPGYVIIERRDLMNAEEVLRKDSLDRLLYALQLNCSAERDENGKVVRWESSRAYRGWIVPIAVGFRAISPLGSVRNQRDPSLPHQFVENVLTLGEFKMPYRFEKLDEILWHYRYDQDNEMYLCVNKI